MVRTKAHQDSDRRKAKLSLAIVSLPEFGECTRGEIRVVLSGMLHRDLARMQSRNPRKIKDGRT